MVAVLAVVVSHQPTPPFRTVGSRREPNQLHALSGPRFAKGLVPHTNDDVHHHLDPDRSRSGTPPVIGVLRDGSAADAYPAAVLHLLDGAREPRPGPGGGCFGFGLCSCGGRWSVGRSALPPVVGMI